MSDEEIYTRLKAHDEKVLEDLYDLYNPLFYSSALFWTGYNINNEDIQDAISETWIYIWKNISGFDPKRSSLKSWALLILKSRLQNKEKINSRFYRKFQTFTIADTDVLEILIQREKCDKIQQLIRQFKSPSKEICSLYFIEEYTVKEISEQLRIPVSKIYYHIYESRKYLKGALDNE